MTTAVRRSLAGGAAPLRPAVTAAALEEFHRKLFLPLVRRAAWKHGLSKEDARDIVQEAFLLAVVKLDPGGNPKAWLIPLDRFAAKDFSAGAARGQVGSRRRHTGKPGR